MRRKIIPRVCLATATLGRSCVGSSLTTLSPGADGVPSAPTVMACEVGRSEFVISERGKIDVLAMLSCVESLECFVHTVMMTDVSSEYRAVPMAEYLQCNLESRL